MKTKTIQMISGVLFLGLFLMQSTVLHAQDPCKVASNIYKKVLLDNDKVRVIEIEFAPGETATLHHHPDHVVYTLTDGKLEITDKGKKSMTMDIKAGAALFLPHVTHMAKNTGTTTLKAIVTELKSPARKKAAAPAKK